MSAICVELKEVMPGSSLARLTRVKSRRSRTSILVNEDVLALGQVCPMAFVMAQETWA